MTDGKLRVVIFSMMDARDIARLVSRIHTEVPRALVCGVLYERGRGKSWLQRINKAFRSIHDPKYLAYVADRIGKAVSRGLLRIGNVAIRFWHACPASPNGRTAFSLDDLSNHLKSNAGCLFLTNDMHSQEALEFVGSLRPHLGVVYGTRILKPELFQIPVHGSINIHKRKVPDYRGGGPIGLWELLRGETDIGVTVHRVEAKVDTGAVIHSATIPIEPFDNLTSLAVKADLLGNDLLVRSVADFARGNVTEKAQGSGGQTFRNPKVQELRGYMNQIAAKRALCRPHRGRPFWKLLLRVILLAPYVLVRNWSRRLRGRFPVVILYHHLVSDRPHRMGIPTAAFLRQVQFLLQHYRVASLREAVDMLRSGSVKIPTVVLTFDDGYRDNFVNLRSVTERTGVPVVLFLCSGHIATGGEFQHDLRWNLRGFLPLSAEQTLSLSSRAEFTLGGHTCSHFDCGSRDANALHREIVGCKADLDSLLGRPIDTFSFPWGLPQNISPEAVQMARATYMHVFSAFGGVNFPSVDAPFWHLKRCPHPSDVLELELQVQSILDRGAPDLKYLS